MDEPFRDGARGAVTPGAEPALAALLEPRGGSAPPAPGELLERVFALRPERFLRRMPGRETFRWPPGGDLVVKRFRGGEARDWWYERLRSLRTNPRSPARREHANLAALAASGFPVPPPVCWVEERGALRRPSAATDGARSAVVMERVAPAADLRARLAAAGPAERRALAERLVALVARLHEEGWYHRDLYLHQVALDAGGGLVLFDLGRARREGAPRRRWFEKDLAALDASAPPAVTRAERARFLRRYLALRGVAPAERRGWARRVRARAARIRAHVPRHVDRESA